MPSRRRPGAALVILALLLGAAPAAAAVSEPRAATLPSFNESPGCGAADGTRGPFASRAGDLPSTEPIFGPWGDFFGRDIAAVRSQLIRLYLPSPTGDVGVWVHARVAPALRAVIRNLEREAAAGRTYTIRSWDTGSYRAATIPPYRYLSFHAIGAAIDVNAWTNPHRLDNVLVTDMPAWFVKAWTDAGWCWGGNWQTKKDPMHFSWEGPLATPGYQTPLPFAPRTAAAAFTRQLSFPTALAPTGAAGETLLVADLDRDGAADAVQVSPWTPVGHLGVAAAQAMHGFTTCTTGEATGWPAVAGAARLLADRDADGRPDLWEIDTSPGTAVLSIYSFASGFTRRLGRLTTSVPVSEGVVFLVGDHDRDRSADLYVVRPGAPARLEVWRGRAFTLALDTALPFATGEGWRYALGDRDGDGIPDLFALGPGPTPELHLADGASGFDTAEAVTLPAAAPAGAFAVEDLDGDGRGDLYFLDGTGTITVYLGGERSSTADADLIYWFYEGHDLHWEQGEGCPTAAGALLRQVEVAATASGPVALYPDPATGGGLLGGSLPGGGQWQQEIPGEARDLAIVTTPEGERLAVLHAGTGTMVSLFTADGALTARVRYGALADVAALVPLDVGGSPALAVLARGEDGATLTVRALDGALLAVLPLAGEPVAVAARPAAAGGSEVILLTSAEAGDRLEAVGSDGMSRATADLPAGGRAEGLALLADGRPAVLWRNGATGRAQVLVFDAALTLVARHAVPPDAGAVLGAAGDDVVVGYRAARNGTVRVLGRDALTGEVTRRALLPAGFDPAAIAAAENGSVLVAGHRLGDGAVLLSQFAPDGTLVVRVRHRPA